MFWEFVTTFVIILFGGLLRVLFFFTPNSDEWVSLWTIKRQIKSRWISYKVDDSVLTGIHVNPILQHFFISRFPEKYWLIIGKLLNVFYDILTAIIIYFISTFYFETQVRLFGISAENLAVLLFLTTPILLPITARITAINSRSQGLLLSTLYLLCIGKIVLNPHASIFFYSILSVVLGLLIVLSSKFAVQAMLFFSFFISILLQKWEPSIIAIIVIALSIMIPLLGSREVMVQSLHHKIWYIKNWHNTPVSDRTFFIGLINMPILLFKSPIRFIESLFYKNFLLIAVYSAPLAFFVLFCTIKNFDEVTFSGVQGYFLAVTLSSFITFLLISTKWLGFLGQAERYFEYSAPFFSILAIHFLVQYQDHTPSSNIIWLIIIIHFIVILLNYILLMSVAMNRNKTVSTVNYQNNSFKESIDWINENLNFVKIVTVPIKRAFLGSYLSNNKTINYYYRFILCPEQTGYSYMNEDTGGYIQKKDSLKASFEIPRLSPIEFKKKYGITHILIDKKTRPGLVSTWGRELSDFGKNLFENEDFLLIEIETKKYNQ